MVPQDASATSFHDSESDGKLRVEGYFLTALNLQGANHATNSPRN